MASDLLPVQEPATTRYFHDSNGVRWRVHADGSVEMRGPREPFWYESNADLAWLLAVIDIVEEVSS